jgi:hypothetical protein
LVTAALVILVFGGTLALRSDKWLESVVAVALAALVGVWVGGGGRSGGSRERR